MQHLREPVVRSVTPDPSPAAKAPAPTPRAHTPHSRDDTDTAPSEVEDDAPNAHATGRVEACIPGPLPSRPPSSSTLRTRRAAQLV